jgi:hypothetical protein
MDYVGPIHYYSFTETILSSSANINLTVFGNLRIEMVFTWERTSYNFIITKWMGVKFQTSARAFLQHTNRDSSKFGSFKEDGAVAITTRQRRELLIQFCFDFVSTIKMIISNYPSSLLDYAVWYRDKRPRDPCRSDYTELVTVTACECLINAGLGGKLLPPRNK